NQLNIPNTLSFIRLLTIPVIFLLIINSTARNFPILISVTFISGLLDFFDGYLARKLSQETELGKILDPVADKLMILALVLGLMIKSNFPLWLGIVIFSRDFIILLASLILLIRKKGKKVVPSVLVGKITVAVLGGLLLVFVVDLHPDVHLEMLKRYFIVLSTGFLAWSWVEYFNVYKKEKNAK
ncbi:MAG: CDP-alcohol phosphatidyltransferase family protein, partial [bacterium]|nr:CDP-alcohol phosphatidyltransferase family protein [bacterium]